jgi:hypothetical protein
LRKSLISVLLNYHKRHNGIKDKQQTAGMENVMNRFIKPIWITSAALMLVLSACGGKTSTPDPASVDAIYTQAAATVGARLTQTASMFTNTPQASPTSNELSTPSATQTPLITNTPEFTSTSLLINTQVPPTQDTCDNMIYVDDVTIPDNSTVAPGSKFIKTWKIRNNGQCTWTTSYRLIFGWAANWPEIVQAPPANVPLTRAVEPGAEYDISVTLTAPLKSGVYMAAFRLQNDRGYNIGDPSKSILFVQFQVNGTATP